MIVNYEKGIIYCALPKVACTEWKRFMKRLQRLDDYLTPESSLIHNPSKSRLDFLPCDGSSVYGAIKKDLQNWRAAAMVRHPCDRVFSAYLDRCIDNKEWTRCGGHLSFIEMVNKFARMDLEHLDIHFRPQSFSCGFGIFPYDYIGKYENIGEESKKLLECTGIEDKYRLDGWPGGGFLQSRIASTNHNRSHNAFDICKYVNCVALRSLERISKPDLDMFGYSMDGIRHQCFREWKSLRFFILNDPLLVDLNQGISKCYEQASKSSLWDGERTDKAQDSSEVWLHSLFLKHKNRVDDILEADIIFLPFYFKMNFEIRSVACQDRKTDIDRLKILHQILSNNQEFMARPDRFLFVCQFWQCKGAHSRYPPVLDSLGKSIMLIHDDNNNWHGNRDESQIITIPYVANSWITSRIKDSRKPPDRRNITVFARLSIRNSPIRKHIAALDWIQYNSSVSTGWDNTSMIKAENSDLTSSFGMNMFSSKFCLHVSGDTPTSRRLYDSIAAGCIPVIVADNILPHLPFRESIPWHSFCVFIESRSVFQRGIDAFETIWKMETITMKKMHQALLQNQKKLIYGGGNPWSLLSSNNELMNEILNNFSNLIHRNCSGFTKH